jgi:hypothetical protein
MSVRKIQHGLGYVVVFDVISPQLISDVHGHVRDQTSAMLNATMRLTRCRTDIPFTCQNLPVSPSAKTVFFGHANLCECRSTATAPSCFVILCLFSGINLQRSGLDGEAPPVMAALSESHRNIGMSDLQRRIQALTRSTSDLMAQLEELEQLSKRISGAEAAALQ